MRSSTFAAAAALFALAACGGPENASDGNSAAPPSSQGSAPASGGTSAGNGAGPGARGGAKLSPGLYETVAEMKIAGLPPEMAKAMEGTHEAKRQCITPEEAAKGSGQLFSGNNENCQQKDVVFAAGRIHGTLVCRDKTGGSGLSTVTVDGSYSGTSYDVTSHMTVQADGKPMTIDAHLVGRRVGDCKGGEES
jgi:hypothetical protein